MDKVIGIVATKGGVGKTTVSASLASTLANSYGKRVLLIDGNYSAPNLGLHMDIVAPEVTIQDVLAGKASINQTIHNRFGVDVIPGSYFFSGKFNALKLKDKIKKLKGDYDFIIIDSSPSLNDEILSSVLAADGVFIVSTPDYPTLSCSLRVAKLVKQRGKKVYGVILNKVTNSNYEIQSKDIEEVMGLPITARISHDPSGIGALFSRMPISVYSKRSKFAKEVSKLCASICDKNEKKSIWRVFIPSDFRREEVNRQILRKSFNNSSKETSEKRARN